MKYIIYTITPILTDNIKLDALDLLSITISRSWRMYTVAIGGDISVMHQSLYKNKQSGEFNEFFGDKIKINR